jgi:putative transcriptional regulator
MINFRLHIVMAERKILKIKHLAEKTGLDANTIAGIYHNKYKRIDLNTLNRLCQVLKCNPADLFEYKPDSVSEPIKSKTTVQPSRVLAADKQSALKYQDRLLAALKKSVYEGDHQELMELSEDKETVRNKNRD